MQKLANSPDNWGGWRYLEDGSINYRLDDPEYLDSRRDFLESCVVKDYTSRELWDELNHDTNHTRKILAWGPGSGKTTKLKLFCSKYHEQGILVVFKTIAEIEHFRFDIQALNPEVRSLGVHSGNPEYKQFKDNISELRNFSILCCTYDFLLRYASHEVFMLKDIFQSMGGNGNRQYLFIDEFPSMYDKVNIGSDYLEKYNSAAKLPDDIPVNGFLTNIYNQITRGARAGNKWLVSEHKHIVGVNEISQASEAVLASRLSVCLSKYQDSVDRFDSFVITMNDFKVPHIFIMDGTSDIGFKDSGWEISKKFSPKLQLSNHIEWGNSFSKSYLLDSEIAGVASRLTEYVQSTGSKVLVCSFKSSEQLYVENNEGIRYAMSETTDVTARLKSHISDSSVLRNISFTHYQSGKTRATNEFINHDTLVLLGDFSINRESLNYMRQVAKSLTVRSYFQAEIIQTLFRTQARVGKPISLITCDVNREVIWRALRYCDVKMDMPISTILDNIIKEDAGNTATMDKVRLVFNNLSKFTVTEVESLVELSITLDEISEFIPFSKRSISKYKPLSAFLYDYNIILEVTSVIGRPTS